MIQTQGFSSSQSLGSLSDEINRWLVANTKELDTKFRLIDIKFAATTTTNPSSPTSSSEVNYCALVTYEVGEVKIATETSQPLETSGVK